MGRYNNIDAGEDIIGTRDIIDRIDELQNTKDGLVEEVVSTREALIAGKGKLVDLEREFDAAQEALGDWEVSDDAVELKTLLQLAEDIEDVSSVWKYGEALIHSNYWVDYIRQLLEKIEEIPSSLPPYVVIDWEATAKNIKVDYSEVDYDGETYYIRNS